MRTGIIATSVEDWWQGCTTW